MSLLICKQCGTQLADGVTFCPSCGQCQNGDVTLCVAKHRAWRVWMTLLGLLAASGLMLYLFLNDMI